MESEVRGCCLSAGDCYGFNFDPEEEPQSVFKNHYKQFKKYGKDKFHVQLNKMKVICGKEKRGKATRNNWPAAASANPWYDSDNDEDDKRDGGNGDKNPPAQVVVGQPDGMLWVPLHLVLLYKEVKTMLEHFAVVIALPAGVATYNTKNIQVSMSDGGKMLVVWVCWPTIMAQEGLDKLQSTWDIKDQDVNFQRMVAAMDSSLLKIKEQQVNGNIAGVFKLPLPFVVLPNCQKMWISNGDECRLLHVDLTIATLGKEDDNEVEVFKQVGRPAAVAKKVPESNSGLE